MEFVYGKLTGADVSTGFVALKRRFVNFFPRIHVSNNFDRINLDFSWIAFRWNHWCRIAFWLFLRGVGMLLLHFGSKATTWWSLNLCGCSWGCSVLSWILLLDWLDGLILEAGDVGRGMRGVRGLCGPGGSIGAVTVHSAEAVSGDWVV